MRVRTRFGTHKTVSTKNQQLSWMRTFSRRLAHEADGWLANAEDPTSVPERESERTASDLLPFHDARGVIRRPRIQTPPFFAESPVVRQSHPLRRKLKSGGQHA